MSVLRHYGDTPEIRVIFIIRSERLKVWNYSLVSSKMSVGSCKIVGIKKGDKMSVNVYTIESLLVGKPYYSRTIQGEIVHAEKDNRAVWYEDCESYLVEIRPTHGFKNAWRTLAVKNPD